MKKVLSVFFIALFILGVLMVGRKFIKPLAFAGNGGTPAAVNHAKGKKDHHPELGRALKKLKMAKEDLEKVRYGLGGHRIKAIRAIDHALVELHMALNFDKK